MKVAIGLIGWMLIAGLLTRMMRFCRRRKIS